MIWSCVVFAVIKIALTFNIAVEEQTLLQPPTRNQNFPGFFGYDLKFDQRNGNNNSLR